MRRKEKARRIGEILDDLYPETPIPLDHESPYQLLVAVLLSAQCKDDRVNEITPHLWKLADNAVDMAQTAVEDVLEIVRPCGLGPTKAKNIVALSQELVERHDGDVPRDLAVLEQLPGVGHKTASVVVTQAFGIPAFPVDTHIHRLAIRWGLTKRGATVNRTEKDLKKVFPRDTWARRHLQIIFFGREHCPALYHELETCPICGWTASKVQIEEERKKMKALKKKRQGKKAG